MKRLLSIDGLTVDFTTRSGIVHAVKGVSISVNANETLAIVGESGSGKSVTAYSVLGLLGHRDVTVKGSIRYDGMELIQPGYPDSCQPVRGRKIAMIFQNPQEGLNPTRNVGQQLCDILRAHFGMSSREGRKRAVELLEEVKIANAVDRYDAYPHELSGGMCQRVMIAIALACEPSLLIADEPTTGLDVTTQKRIMELLLEKRAERRMATMIITHDLALASMYADRIVVMEAGRVVEEGPSRVLFKSPREDYTRKLIEATPRPDVSIGQLLDAGETAVARPSCPASAGDASVLLSLDRVTKEYPIPTAGDPYRMVPVVKDVSFSVYKGECIGIVGESGSGKSTLGRMISRLIDQTSGTITFDDALISQNSARSFSRSPFRKDIQFVFQNASLSLNPRWSISQTIVDALKHLGITRERDVLRDRVLEVALQVGLPIELLGRFPHQLSGGQKARAGIGRAIAPHPRLLILDEPTTALDVSVQAVVLKELQRLIKQLSLTVLFISHDLNVVRMLCDRVIVLKAGEIVETANTADLFERPSTDYVAELIGAIPKPPG